jgi:hypothetical protein
MIKYKFAYNSQEMIVNINNLSRENGSKLDKFTCLSCDCEMVAVLGATRVKHFRHKVITKDNCSPETYLHKLAKIKFYDTYQDCLNNNKPFKIKILMERICNFYREEFFTNCQLDSELYEFNLTDFFKKVYLETRESSFIPDVLLEARNGDKLFFEIYVTHKSEATKIESGYRIIEFKVDSEEDIQIIESCLLTESEKIRFFNFKKTQTKIWCKGECYQGIVPYAKEDILYTVFIVYKNGKCILFRNSIQQLENLDQNNILHIEYLSFSHDCSDFSISYQGSDLYKHQVVECYKKGIKIKNCFLCRYHAINTSLYSDGGIFCKFLKTTGNSNQAANCEYFRPDSKAFAQYHNEFY